MKQLFLIFCASLIVSCNATKPVINPITDFPIKPSLVTYPTPPVIKKIDNNYVVIKELVENASLLTDYYKRLESWKEVKNIK
jgi:hypothetical protein